MLLSGCAAKVVSIDSPINIRASNDFKIGIYKVSSTFRARTGPVSNNELVNTLVSESNGIVIADKKQPLRLWVDFQFDSSFNSNDFSEVLLGTLTIIPPLAFIPSTDTAHYDVTYKVMDQQNNIVFQHFANNTVSGESIGWWMARINAQSNMVEKEAKVAAANAARAILQDIQDHNSVFLAALSTNKATRETALSNLGQETQQTLQDKASYQQQRIIQEQQEEAQRQQHNAAMLQGIQQIGQAAQGTQGGLLQGGTTMASAGGLPAGPYSSWSKAQQDQAAMALKNICGSQCATYHQKAVNGSMRASYEEAACTAACFVNHLPNDYPNLEAFKQSAIQNYNEAKKLGSNVPVFLNK